MRSPIKSRTRLLRPRDCREAARVAPDRWSTARRERMKLLKRKSRPVTQRKEGLRAPKTISLKRGGGVTDSRIIGTRVDLVVRRRMTRRSLSLPRLIRSIRPDTGEGLRRTRS